MFNVICGKAKASAAVGSLVDPCIIVGGSFAGYLKAYQKSDLTEVTGIGLTPWTSNGGTTVNAVASDSNYIYFGGVSTVTPGSGVIYQIAKTDKACSVKLSRSDVTGDSPYTGIVVDGSAIHVSNGKNANTGNKYRNSNGGKGSSSLIYRAAAITVMGDYAYTGGAGTTMAKWDKNSTGVISPITTLLQSSITGLCNDGTYIYASLSASPYLKVFDANLVEQSGYPTLGGQCYCIINDSINIYVGSTTGRVNIINKSTKNLEVNTNFSGYINAIAQDSTYIYYGGDSGDVFRLAKSDLGNGTYPAPTTLKSGIGAKIYSICLT